MPLREPLLTPQTDAIRTRILAKLAELDMQARQLRDLLALFEEQPALTEKFLQIYGTIGTRL